MSSSVVTMSSESVSVSVHVSVVLVRIIPSASMSFVASGMLGVVVVVSHVETVSEEKLSSSGLTELVDESSSEDLASVGNVPPDKVEFVHADDLSDT